MAYAHRTRSRTRLQFSKVTVSAIADCSGLTTGKPYIALGSTLSLTQARRKAARRCATVAGRFAPTGPVRDLADRRLTLLSVCDRWQDYERNGNEQRVDPHGSLP